jgi:uncharacterized protein
VYSLDKLCRWFAPLDGVLVALSGGVDSSVLAAVAFRVLREKAVAATIKSELQSQEDVKNAKRVASEIGIEHLVLHFKALEVEEIRENRPSRCYLCKRGMAERLCREARRRGRETVVDGTNASDRVEDRPGMKALQEFGIRMPLRELNINKEEVRAIARELGLSVLDRPSRSCLAPRVEGVLTSKRLKRVEEAEKILPQGWKITDRGDLAELSFSEESEISYDLISALEEIGYRKIVRGDAKR